MLIDYKSERMFLCIWFANTQADQIHKNICVWSADIHSGVIAVGKNNIQYVLF